MSGGHFDYAYHRVNDFADELARFIARQGQPCEYSTDGVYPTFRPDVTATLERIRRDCERLSAEMKAVEWFASGDTSDPDFLLEVGDIHRRHTDSEREGFERADFLQDASPMADGWLLPIVRRSQEAAEWLVDHGKAAKHETMDWYRLK